MDPVTRATAVPPNFFGALLATLTHAHTLEAVARPLLELLQKMTGLESAYLTRLDESKLDESRPGAPAGMLSVLYARNTYRLTIPEGMASPWSGTLCKRALDEGRFYTEDAGARWSDCEATRTLGIVTFLSAPVRGKGGALFGTLCAASGERKSLPETAVQVLQLFAHLVSQQVDRERLLSALHEANNALASMVLTDAVTQLPNRRALLDELERRLGADQGERALIVAFIDLDNFKPINDRFGNEAGDQFLNTVAKRLRRMLRDSDMAARIGGDEFVVLAVEDRAKAQAAATALARRLESATQGRFKLDSALFDYGSASVGVVVAEPGCFDAQALLNRADAAMDAVKRSRKHRASMVVPTVRTIARYEWPVIE